MFVLRSGSATRAPRLASLRRALSSAEVSEVEWSAAGAEFEAAARVASTVLACAPGRALAPGDVVVNLGAHSLTGSMITQGADKIGLTVVSVVPEGVVPGLHDMDDENKYYVNQQYMFHGATAAITERFVNFRGFDELIADVGEPALIINGESTVSTGQAALKKFTAAKTFTAKKAAVEDMQDDGTYSAAKYVSSLGRRSERLRYSAMMYVLASPPLSLSLSPPPPPTFDFFHDEEAAFHDNAVLGR